MRLVCTPVPFSLLSGCKQSSRRRSAAITLLMLPELEQKQQIWQRTSLWPTGCEQSEIISISSLPQTVSAKIANILGNYMLRLCSNFCLFYKLICLHFLELECMLWCGRVGFGLGIRRVVAITLLAPMHCCKNNVSATVGGWNMKGRQNVLKGQGQTFSHYGATSSTLRRMVQRNEREIISLWQKIICFYFLMQALMLSGGEIRGK